MTADTAALFDAAQSAIREVIANDQVLALNETETRTHLIDPVLAALGYQSLDTVRREHRLPASGQVIDYLLTAGEHRIAVEAKSVGTELAAREGSQLVGYAAQEGIRWGLLTNGLHWQIYDIEAFRKLGEQEGRRARSHGGRSRWSPGSSIGFALPLCD